MAATIIEPRTDEFIIERPTPPGKMTYEEFLDWADGEHAEWEDGEVVWMSPVTWQHKLIDRFLFRTLSDFADAKQLGEVINPPFQMKVGPSLSGREPDIFFIETRNVDRIKAKYYDGPADLAVEVVSPESRKRDRVTKLREYEQGGVREYWLIDPLTMEAAFYEIDADGRYQKAALEADGYYYSKVMPGVRIDPEWFWQDAMPAKEDVLKLWGLP